MQKLSLIKDHGDIRKYKLHDGRFIEIDVSDDHEIIVKDNQKNLIGKIELSYRDDGLPGSVPYYHITWMYMDLIDDSYKHQGIGREALLLFIEVNGLKVTASDNDGLKKNDGSHLTGDAPTFIQKMRDEGIVE